MSKYSSWWDNFHIGRQFWDEILIKGPSSSLWHIDTITVKKFSGFWLQLGLISEIFQTYFVQGYSSLIYENWEHLNNIDSVVFALAESPQKKQQPQKERKQQIQDLNTSSIQNTSDKLSQHTSWEYSMKHNFLQLHSVPYVHIFVVLMSHGEKNHVEDCMCIHQETVSMRCMIDLRRRLMLE